MTTKHRPLFVATPANANVVAGLEQSARNRGHSAISVLDPRHAASIAKAFRPNVVVFVAPPGTSAPAQLKSLSNDAGLRALPRVVLAPSRDPSMTVAFYEAGAAAVELLETGIPALERVLASASIAAHRTPPERALDALDALGVRGSLVVTRPVDLVVRFGPGEDTDRTALLPKLRELDAAVEMHFEPWTEPVEFDDAEIVPIEDAPPSERDVTDRLGPARVLIVEDDAGISKLYARLFEHDGFTVTMAPDGIAGYESVLASPPDVVVTDIAMPRADGWELVGRLRDDARVREIPIVMISNFTDMLGQLKGLRVGADAYLEKGGANAELVAVARALVDRRRAARLTASTAPAPCSGRLEDVGPSGLLLALEEGKRSGTLHVAAAWGTVTLAYVEGVIRGARADFDDLVLEAEEALLLLLELGETTWRLEEDVALLMEGPNATYSSMQAQLAAALTARRAAATIAAATRRGMTIVEERARVYVGTAEEARALVDRLAAGNVDEKTRAAFRDLVRRGVAR